jgi:hypothetical protein
MHRRGSGDTESEQLAPKPQNDKPHKVNWITQTSLERQFRLAGHS